ncbi:MAG: hypothetical protein JNL94_02550 [Planctomycetes bacterium]|nr:hypothetical protein [Planctomycetota bacterium]
MTAAARGAGGAVMPVVQLLAVRIACSQPIGRTSTVAPTGVWIGDASCWNTALPLVWIVVPNWLLAVYAALIVLHRWTIGARGQDGLGFAGAMTACGVVHAVLLIAVGDGASSFGPWLALIAFALPALALYVAAFQSESRPSPGEPQPRQGGV